MNLPGRIHVIDLRVDSRLDMVETWATRKDSYCARAEDIESEYVAINLGPFVIRNMEWFIACGLHVEDVAQDR